MDENGNENNLLLTERKPRLFPSAVTFPFPLREFFRSPVTLGKERLITELSSRNQLSPRREPFLTLLRRRRGIF